MILKTKFQRNELLLALLVIPGMALVVGNVPYQMYMGIIVGLISAFLAAVFSVWNKLIIDKADPMDITFIEMSSGWLFISLFKSSKIVVFILYESIGSSKRWVRHRR